jgi:putative toxin-antitoxin system antitoxin component (TIGR02293 family)
MWHNVHMAHAAAAHPNPPHPFSYDWREVEKGVPLSALDEFSKYSGIPAKNLLDVVIPPRTLKHRRERKEPLSIDESDRLARVARVYEFAVSIFGNTEKGREWLLTPFDQFKGRSALDLLRTGAGAQLVEETLYQIDEGVFA